MRYIPIASAYLLSAIFAFAGIDKILHFRGFINALDTYAIVPSNAGKYIALPIICAELCIALGLLVKIWRREAAIMAAACLAAFTVALIVNHKYAPDATCGCWFSITLGTSTLIHILQDAVLTGLAIMVWNDNNLLLKLQRKVT
jgi:hypothetical protein